MLIMLALLFYHVEQIFLFLYNVYKFLLNVLFFIKIQPNVDRFFYIGHPNVVYDPQKLMKIHKRYEKIFFEKWKEVENEMPKNKKLRT